MVEHRSPKPSVEGSSPSAPANMHADIAQQVEHFLGKEEVTGSSPVISSILFVKYKRYSMVIPLNIFNFIGRKNEKEFF